VGGGEIFKISGIFKNFIHSAHAVPTHHTLIPACRCPDNDFIDLPLPALKKYSNYSSSTITGPVVSLISPGFPEGVCDSTNCSTEIIVSSLPSPINTTHRASIKLVFTQFELGGRAFTGQGSRLELMGTFVNHTSHSYDDDDDDGGVGEVMHLSGNLTGRLSVVFDWHEMFADLYSAKHSLSLYSAARGYNISLSSILKPLPCQCQPVNETSERNGNVTHFVPSYCTQMDCLWRLRVPPDYHSRMNGSTKGFPDAGMRLQMEVDGMRVGAMSEGLVTMSGRVMEEGGHLLRAHKL